MMTNDIADLALIGTRIERIRRVLYQVGTEVDRNDGALELSFSDGSVRLYDSGPDGERLIVADRAWKDPYEGRMDEVNQAHIAEAGKWTAFDVSDESPYDRFIGAAVESVLPIATPDGRAITGMRLCSSAGRLEASVIADELIVLVDHMA